MRWFRPSFFIRLWRYDLW